jgi:hypothetical protein
MLGISEIFLPAIGQPNPISLFPDRDLVRSQTLRLSGKDLRESILA